MLLQQGREKKKKKGLPSIFGRNRLNDTVEKQPRAVLFRGRPFAQSGVSQHRLALRYTLPQLFPCCCCCCCCIDSPPGEKLCSQRNKFRTQKSLCFSDEIKQEELASADDDGSPYIRALIRT
jgi:hypothetical protein